MIKVGTLCWLIADAFEPRHIGRVCEVTGPPIMEPLNMGNGYSLAPPVYPITATWCVGEGWFSSGHVLRPFSDPDNSIADPAHQPVTETA